MQSKDIYNVVELGLARWKNGWDWAEFKDLARPCNKGGALYALFFNFCSRHSIAWECNPRDSQRDENSRKVRCRKLVWLGSMQHSSVWEESQGRGEMVQPSPRKATGGTYPLCTPFWQLDISMINPVLPFRTLNVELMAQTHCHVPHYWVEKLVVWWLWLLPVW